ncbi:DUF2330 domain-containing protein [Miniimonas sp. S16]|uniref:DUF2330 domain-containing protein n=1 Tax=Miniimonas sp. S16 TaxID=2171623 RepID=UPI000D529B5C|nr:DUF2330 domain-containing protein [Miniimonas sp. S16]
MTARRAAAARVSRARRPNGIARAAAVAGAVAVLGGSLAGPAAAAGGVTTTAGELGVIRQEAAMALVDGNEHLVIDLNVTGELDAGTGGMLLVATPSQPTVTPLADDSLLDAFRSATAPVEIVEERWWPDLESFSGAADEVDPGDQPVLPLVADETGGVYGLGPAGGNDVAEWFTARGYAVSQGMLNAINAYAAGGWYFTAIGFTASPTGAVDLADGAEADDRTVEARLPAVELVFPTGELVYPMLLSADSSDALELRTYVLGAERLDRTDPMRGLSKVSFAGAVSTSVEPGLAPWLDPLGGSGYITAVDQTFTSPSRISSDIRFATSGYGDVTPEPVTVAERKILLGMPAGPVLVFGGMVVLAIVGIVVSRVLQARDDER